MRKGILKLLKNPLTAASRKYIRPLSVLKPNPLPKLFYFHQLSTKPPSQSFSILDPSNQSSSSITYSHISDGFIEDVNKAASFLLAQEGVILSESVAIFHENFFHPEKRLEIPNKIAKLIAEGKKGKKSSLDAQVQNQGGQPPSPGKKKSPAERKKERDKIQSGLAYEILKAMKSIIEFLDYSNRGLLTGDLSTETIAVTEKATKKALELLKNSSDFTDSNLTRDKIIYSCYSDVIKTAMDGLFRLPKNGIKYPEHENPRNLFERQLLLEDESNDIAIEKFLSVYEDLQNIGLSFNLQFARKYIVEWFPNLTRAIKEEQEACMVGDLKGDRRYYGEYVLRIPSEKLALLCLTELMKSVLKLTQRRKDDDIGENQPKSYFLVSKVVFDSIGRAVNAQLIFDFEQELAKQSEKNNKKLEGDDLPPEANPMTKPSSPASVSGKLFKKKLESEQYRNIGMPRNVQMKLGSLLVYLMKEVIKVKNTYGFWVPLITTGFVKGPSQKYMVVGVLNIEDSFLLRLMNKIDKKDSLFVQLDRSLPMIFKPAPWRDVEMGGYFQKPTNLMRINESQIQENAIKFADLNQIFHVLDLMGTTPWRINKNVLRVVEQIWEEGGGSGEIPLKNYDYSNYVYQYQIDECRNREEKQKLMRKLQNQRDLHSLRCDFTLKLNIATAFKDVGRIYFPQNIDFRGRIYPICPHLNHIGADICRGLLEFAEGKPIGPNGVYWLKIQCANKMGQDKLSFPDRINYVESMMSIIQKCAKDPFKHRDWLKFEDSWQSLGAMIELNNALNHPKPEEYVSHMHIHMDGSCNGLQHYAALGRDFEGARQVNLMKTERPGDVYTHVANMVQARVNADASNKQSEFHDIATKLVGNIKRKIVKQTVMTSVYGVTFIGARQQIYKQLRDKDFLNEEEKDAYVASFYIAKLTLDCLKDLFSGAHYIKKWLIECAGLISDSGNPVSWITPMGLPVVQPYRSKSQMDVITTVIQKVMVADIEDNLPINKNKQKSAFPPNFIHSLDSTHLMYTAMQCRKEGITFAAVHDSFWTHASTIDRMNEVLRDQFINLHSQPLLENLKLSFERRFPDIQFPEIPNRGDFKLDHVKASIYFFA